MKIDRLYTLSQFIDLVGQTDKNHEKCYGNVEIYKEAKNKCVSMVVLIADKIIAYNEFLKQPLSKEMFVNEIEKPDKKEYGNFTSHPHLTENELYELALEIWQEAEKKVIFEGKFSFKYYDDGAIRIDLYDDVIIILQNGFGKTTLEEIARQTNGQLKTKNIEL